MSAVETLRLVQRRGECCRDDGAYAWGRTQELERRAAGNLLGQHLVTEGNVLIDVSTGAHAPGRQTWLSFLGFPQLHGHPSGVETERGCVHGAKEEAEFHPEDRAEAVRRVRKGTKPLPQVAKDLDLTESALRNWVNEAQTREESRPAATLTAAEREELLRLRKENRQLQMERDFLKNSSGSSPHRLLRKKLGRGYPRASPGGAAVCYKCQQLGLRAGEDGAGEE